MSTPQENHAAFHAAIVTASQFLQQQLDAIDTLACMLPGETIASTIKELDDADPRDDTATMERQHLVTLQAIRNTRIAQFEVRIQTIINSIRSAP